MKNKVKNISFLLTAALMWLVNIPTHAGLISDELWQVQYGDTLDSVVKTVAPSVKRTEPDLRSIILRLNPAAFQSDGDLITGRILRIPGAKLASVANTVAPNASRTPTQFSTRQSVVAGKSLVGHVVIAAGTLQATDTEGRYRTLIKQSQVYEGDKLTTSSAGHAQLRFTDGALIALRPDTEFKVDSYRFVETQDGTEQGIFSLLKGGFRTITGLIGKKNKQNYRVNTAVATIGIRGTHYGLRLCDAANCAEGGNIKAGLYGGVVDGSITVMNDAGEKIFNNDQYFHVTGRDVSPRGLIAPPGILFNGEELKLSKQQRAQLAKELKENKTKAEALRKAKAVGNASAEKLALFIRNNKPEVDKPAVSGSDARVIAPKGAAMVFSALGEKFPDPTVGAAPFGISRTMRSLGSEQQAIVLATENLEKDFPLAARLSLGDNLVDAQGVPVQTLDFRLSRGKDTRLKDDGYDRAYRASWGRWDADYTVALNGVAAKTVGSLHYLYSPSTTSIAALENLGTLLGEVTYNNIGGTSPTDMENNVGRLVKAHATVDFLSRKVTDYYVETDHGGQIYEGRLDRQQSLVSASALQMGMDRLSLRGVCSGGALCGQGAELSGQASLTFLNKGNEVAKGAASAFSLTGTTPGGVVGTTGAVLMERSVIPLVP